MAAKMEVAKKPEVKKRRPTIFKRILWIFLVGVIPFLVVIVLVGVTLQIIGFPILHTVEDMVGLTKHPATVSTALEQTKQDLAVETAKERLDSSQILALRQQIRQNQQQMAVLMSQLNQLQSQTKSQALLQEQAKKEAQVLSQMDPGQAASVLAKMQSQEAAATVAALSPSDSGAILSQMNPTSASRLLSAASALQSEDSQMSNSIGNSTGS